jgi:hypothetical protein
MKELIFRALRADEIDVRVATVNEKGVSLLLYKDARCDMNVLDETVGKFGWDRDHKELKGNIYCGVSIYDDEKGVWVTKWDCGAESFTEKEKGEASDSFKRACFNWGIGRELYTAPFIWIPNKNVKVNGKDKPLVKIEKDDYGKWKTKDRFTVYKMEVTDKQITGLGIGNETQRVIAYEWDKK